ncbi:MAG: TIM barrel protein, partial [bacterium]
NLDYPLNYLDTIFNATGVSLCVDIGHQLAYRNDVMELLRKYWERIRVFHLHWHDGTNDHLAIPDPMPQGIRELLQFLMRKDFQGLLTIEVFSEKDFEQSMKTVKDFLSL